MMQRLAGKVALITGGARGIGRAVADRFVAEGAVVVVADLSAPEGLAHHFMQGDVGTAAGCTALITRVIRTSGRLDILVNNAGIQAPTPGDSFDDDVFERILRVNLIGAATCAREAIAHFLSRPGGGVVINTSSAHEIIPKPGYLAYSLSKGGMANLTRTLALEFADRGVRVNAVAPGATLTDMNQAWAPDPVKRHEVEAHIPMGRAATPEELAPVYAFLASEEASYITGQTIHACGGLTLFGEFKQNWAS